MTKRFIKIESDYFPGRPVYTLCKGKIRKGTIEFITAKLKKSEGLDISDIHSVAINIEPTENFAGEQLVIDGNRRIDHFIFFTKMEAINAVTSELPN